MVSMLTSSMVVFGFEPQVSQIGIYCFFAKYAELIRAKTGWIGVRIICQSGAACLTTDCCCTELAL